MIDNFEEITHELTDEEKVLLPIITKALKKKIGKEMAVTNSQMIKGLKTIGHTVRPARIRKLIHHIRITGEIDCLVATSKGYYVSNDIQEMDTYIESLLQRAKSIEEIANQMQFQRNKMSNV